MQTFEAVEPETGIHVRFLSRTCLSTKEGAIGDLYTKYLQSLAWSNAITPQPGTFLWLPIEVRHKIYQYVLLDSFTGPGALIRPRKSGERYLNTYRPYYNFANSLTSKHETLSLISRQTYVDVIGGILHSVNQ